MRGTPIALLRAQRLIFREIRRTAPIHSIRLELATEPDQYRVSYRLPGRAEAHLTYSLMPRIEATESEAAEATAWLAAFYPGGLPW